MLNSVSGFRISIWSILLLGYMLSGCSTSSELFRLKSLQENVEATYSIIYYIHADSDYLYHDASGNAQRENKKVLQSAIKVAETAKSGEVFVFYQASEKKFLGLFPRNRSQFYHYINGELTTHLLFRHSDTSEAFLSTEALLFNQYRSQTAKQEHRSYFLFFGHEIPSTGGLKYHHSLPRIAVNTETFSAGIQKFLNTKEQLFQLVVLSTCNNGTPLMATALMSFSEVLLASPQNLHLSHIDSNNLHLLETHPQISPIQLANEIAESTFIRLKSEVQTTVTLTVYDFKIIQEQQKKLFSFIDSYLYVANMDYVSDNIDCDNFSIFESQYFANGIQTRYKGAKFGRNANITIHSGWGCKPLLKPE